MVHVYGVYEIDTTTFLKNFCRLAFIGAFTSHGIYHNQNMLILSLYYYKLRKKVYQ